VFRDDEVSQLLDVPNAWTRSQVRQTTGVCYDPRRPRGGGVTLDELLALAILRYLQECTEGKYAEVTRAAVRELRPFLVGIMDDPSRTLSVPTVPVTIGRISVSLHIPPDLITDLRARVAFMRSSASYRVRATSDFLEQQPRAIGAS
jgi:hypothetical protein